MMNCASCRYFAIHEDDLGAVRGDGECHRHAPQIVVVNGAARTLFPVVMGGCDWCGEYAAIHVAPETALAKRRQQPTRV